MFYVYHLHLDGMSLDQGYVGVSNDPKRRFSTHKRSSDNPVLKKVFSKYGEKVRQTILAVFDTIEEALWQEFTLRPTTRIGWNIAVGGGLPPDSKGKNNPNYGKIASKETREKQSKARVGKFTGKDHPTAKVGNIYSYATKELIAENVVISVWAENNGFHRSHLLATAYGKYKQHKGLYARLI